jgi:hypothetical protein
MTDTPKTERRVSKRKRTLLAAKVVFADGASTVDCVIRDRSETGAKISLGSFATLPEDFDLIIAGRGEHLSAQMVWSRGEELGVSFQDKPLSAEAQKEEAESLRRRIRDLESTVSKLQSRIRELSE